MNIIPSPSPNFNSRDGHAIDMLVLHYTGMRSGAAALDRLCAAESKVSAHYLVEEDGRIFQLVAEEHRAWHAGVSYWRGHTNINQRSIGIEIVNPGHEYGYRDFPEAQMEAVTQLCQAIVKRHPIPARNVVAHSDVAPTRKEDPGERFDWKGLAKVGIGIFPGELYAKYSLWQIPLDIMHFIIGMVLICASGLFWLAPGINGRMLHKNNKRLYSMAIGRLPSPAESQEKLAYFGYDTTDLPSAIKAFQRHFFPTRLTGKWDRECAIRLASLLEQLE